MNRPWSQGAERLRKRTIEARLAEFDLVGGPRLAKAIASTPAVDSRPWGARFGEAVQGLGPGFVLFARYLSTRPDLLSLDDVFVLEELGLDSLAKTLPPRGDPQIRLAAELGRPVGDVFAEFDPSPITQGWLYEEFRARLQMEVEGEVEARRGLSQSPREVVVRLRRPGLGDIEATDLADLVHLRPAFKEILEPSREGEDWEQLLRVFLEALIPRLDLRNEETQLLHFAEDLVDSDLLVVPQVYPALSTERLSVRENLPGESFPGLWGGGDVGFAAGLAHRQELARRLHLAWLEQALIAGHIPLDADWVELRDGRLAIVGGRFERLGAVLLPQLWTYLRHLAGHRPEEAYRAIAGELRAVRRGADERDLRLRLRQLVPFRDGGWTDRRDTLAEYLVLQWKLVRELGFEPSASLENLWRGLFQMALEVRHLQVPSDSLRAALEDLRWLASFRRMRQLAEPGQLGPALEANLASLMEMPQKLDRLLEVATGEGGGDLRLRLRVAEDASAERRRGALTTAVCLGLLMTAVALLAGQLPELGVPESWVEPGSAVAFLGLGALLIRTITRR
ncbi:MAG: hypothetical protein K0U98_25465 [Deltaproteobacteria bacterium]|nr:hypothetical protein [Deltaproteobacteria bacterium]